MNLYWYCCVIKLAIGIDQVDVCACSIHDATEQACCLRGVSVSQIVHITQHNS